MNNENKNIFDNPDDILKYHKEQETRKLLDKKQILLQKT